MIDIDACKRGNKETLGELYAAYAPKLKSVCRSYVKDESVAEDILHDAFIIIFTSIGELKEGQKLEGWMITIVKNLSLKHLRHMQKHSTSLLNLNREVMDDTLENGQSVELDVLLQTIDALPKGSREVFKLSVLDGLSHKEIGRMLGINPHSSSSQLFRAKKMLQAMLSNYWGLLLLPLFIPIYIYMVTRQKAGRLTTLKPRTTKQRQATPKKTKAESIKANANQPAYSTPTPTTPAVGDSKLAQTVAHNGTSYFPNSADSTKLTKTILPFDADTIQRKLAVTHNPKDTLPSSLPAIATNKHIALNEQIAHTIKPKKKYPWTFNLGYSSNAGANSALSNQNYLTMIDYANGGATAKLYTWEDCQNYLTRNKALMDSVERARLTWIVNNNIDSPTDAGVGLGEKANHHRPITLGFSLNRQLSLRWTFGTGLMYTSLNSEFESEYHRATLKKTQRVDYLGIPLRLTYHFWNKGRFNAYTTGGVTFEMPIYGSLAKKYTITTDSMYTSREDIKARSQWSVNLGVGVQYRLFKPFSVYLEPNMFYYFGNASGVETYRTEHPFIITVPFGLRLTW